jgi:hypothetical protein
VGEHHVRLFQFVIYPRDVKRPICRRSRGGLSSVDAGRRDLHGLRGRLVTSGRELLAARRGERNHDYECFN